MAQPVYDKKTKLIVNAPLNWVQAQLSKQAKSLVFDTDEEGNIKAMPVILIDPTAAMPNASIPVHIADPTTPANQANVITLATSPSISMYTLLTQTVSKVYRPSTGIYESQRAPEVFKQANCAVAPATTDVWLPTNRFRVLGGLISMSGTIAAAATRTIQLIEETAGTVIIQASVTIPVLGFNVAFPFVLGLNGYIASTAAKKLQAVTSGATYVAGIDTVSVWGTDE